MIRRRVLALCGSVLASGLAGCNRGDGGGNKSSGRSTESGQWRGFRGGPSRSGIGPAAQGPGESLAVDWNRSMPDIVRALEEVDPTGENWFVSGWVSSPTVLAGIVVPIVSYQAQNTEAGEITEDIAAIGLDHGTGELNWSRSLIGSDRSGGNRFLRPVAADGVLYVASTRNKNGFELLELDPETGTINDRTDLVDSYEPTVVNGTVYQYTRDNEGGFVALDLSGGGQLWQTKDTLSVTPSMPLTHDDGRLFHYDRQGEPGLVSIDADDGSIRWRSQVAIESLVLGQYVPLTPPVLGEDAAYVAGGLEAMSKVDTAALVALDPDDGTETWRYQPPESGATPAGGNAGTGEPPGVAAVYGHPLVYSDGTDDLVVATGFGDPNGTEPVDREDAAHLFGIDAGSGELSWSLSIDSISFSPVAAGGRIYVATSNSLHAVSRTGDRLDTLEFDSSGALTESSPALAHGRLFVPTVDGIVAVG
jgi:outer membrane protein assembly factor BamB